MTKESDLKFHGDGLHENLNVFLSGRGEIDRREAAFYALEAAGSLYREGAEVSSLLAPLTGQKLRSEFLCAAADYSSGVTWPERMRSILTKEEMTDGDLELVTACVLFRDRFEAACAVASALATRFSIDQAHVCRLHSLASRIDGELLSRPDVLCVAQRILKPDFQSPLWLSQARNLDRAMEEAFLQKED